MKKDTKLDESVNNITMFNQKDKDYLSMDLDKIQEIMYLKFLNKSKINFKRASR